MAPLPLHKVWQSTHPCTPALSTSTRCPSPDRLTCTTTAITNTTALSTYHYCGDDHPLQPNTHAHRYTAFIPLYPLGVLAEMTLMYDALPALDNELDGRSGGGGGAAGAAYSLRLPNAWNAAFDYATFLRCVLLAYPFLWWQLYSMLLGQRRKRLAPARAEGATMSKND